MRITESMLRKIIRQEIVGQAVRSGRMSLREGRHILAEGMPIILSPSHLMSALEKNGGKEEMEKLKAAGAGKLEAIKLGLDQEKDTRGVAQYTVMKMDGNPLGDGISVSADKLKGAGIFDPNSSKLL
jgi:hypothetical protein